MPTDPAGRPLSAAYLLQLLVLHYRDTRCTSFKDPANTPLLRRKHGNVTYTYFKKTLKAHMSNLSEDPTFLTSHSLRIGGATALIAAGASQTAVKQAGRWLSSDMPGSTHTPPQAAWWPSQTGCSPHAPYKPTADTKFLGGSDCSTHSWLKLGIPLPQVWLKLGFFGHNDQPLTGMSYR